MQDHERVGHKTVDLRKCEFTETKANTIDYSESVDDNNDNPVDGSSLSVSESNNDNENDNENEDGNEINESSQSPPQNSVGSSLPPISCFVCSELESEQNPISVLGCTHSIHRNCVKTLLIEANKSKKTLHQVVCKKCAVPIDYVVLETADPESAAEISLRTAIGEFGS